MWGHKAKMQKKATAKIERLLLGAQHFRALICAMRVSYDYY